MKYYLNWVNLEYDRRSSLSSIIIQELSLNGVDTINTDNLFAEENLYTQPYLDLPQWQDFCKDLNTKFDTMSIIRELSEFEVAILLEQVAWEIVGLLSQVHDLASNRILIRHLDKLNLIVDRVEGNETRKLELLNGISHLRELFTSSFSKKA